jgi:hypothetical protein
MNSKWSGRKRSDPTGVQSRHLVTYTVKTSVKIAGNSAKPRTEHLLNTSIYLSICLSMYLYIYDSTALYWALAAFSISWSFTQSVGLLGRGICPSLGRYLHTEQHKHRINAYKYPCLKWDSNPRSQCFSGRREFMRPLGSAEYKHTCIAEKTAQHSVVLTGENSGWF